MFQKPKTSCKRCNYWHFKTDSVHFRKWWSKIFCEAPKLLLCALLNIDYHYKARQVKGKLHSAAMVVKRCWLSNADPPFKIFWPFYLPPNVFIAANCTGLSFHEIFANNIFEKSFSGHRRIQVQLRWKMKSTTIFPNSSVPSLSPRS